MGQMYTLSHALNCTYNCVFVFVCVCVCGVCVCVCVCVRERERESMKMCARYLLLPMCASEHTFPPLMQSLNPITSSTVRGQPVS